MKALFLSGRQQSFDLSLNRSYQLSQNTKVVSTDGYEANQTLGDVDVSTRKCHIESSLIYKHWNFVSMHYDREGILVPHILYANPRSAPPRGQLACQELPRFLSKSIRFSDVVAVHWSEAEIPVVWPQRPIRGVLDPWWPMNRLCSTHTACCFKRTIKQWPALQTAGIMIKQS